jgi:hypothetical protein
MDPLITVILYAVYYILGTLGFGMFALTLCECYEIDTWDIQRNRRVLVGALLSIVFLAGMSAAMFSVVWTFLPAFAYVLYQIFAPTAYKAPMLVTRH